MEKLISQSKKEMRNVIQAKLRVITWKRPPRKFWELSHLLEVKAQFYKFFKTESYTLKDVFLTVYIIPDL